MIKMSPFARQATVLFSVLCMNFLLVSCQMKSSAPKDAQVTPLQSQTQHIRNGIQLKTGDLNVKVQFYADNVVRVVKWTPQGTPEKASLIVVQTNVPDLRIDFQETAETITFGSRKITVQLSKSDGAIQYLADNSQPILKEQGEAVITPVQMKHETKAFSVQQNFKLTPDEGIYGLGSINPVT